MIPETFFSVRRELLLFLLSCAAGALICGLYDLLRLFRLTVRHGRFAVFAEDLLFLAGYAVFLSAFASAAALGQLRAYFAVGNCLGAVLYRFTVGAAVMKTARTILGAVGKLLKALFSPPLRVCILLCRKGKVKFVGCYKNMGNRLKKVKIPLQKRPHLLYNSNVSKQAGNTDPRSTAPKRKVSHFAEGKRKKEKKARPNKRHGQLPQSQKVQEKG